MALGSLSLGGSLVSQGWPNDSLSVGGEAGAGAGP